MDFARWVRLMVALTLGTVLGVGLGCSKQRRSREPEVTAAPPRVTALVVPVVIDAGPPEDASLAAAPPGTVGDLLADLDGDGKPERALLSAKGVLSVGAATLQLAALSESPLTLAALDLDAATPERHLVITQQTVDVEDPPGNKRLVRYRGGVLTKVFDVTHSSFRHDELTLDSGGVSILQDGWEACDNAPAGASREKQRLHFRFDGTGMLVEAGRTPSGEIQDCEMLAACPFVYVGPPGHEVLVGAILRNLRGRVAATTQGLELPTGAAVGGVLRVRLAELEPEVTHLDGILADIDGALVAPLECSAASAATRPAFCEPDGRAHLMSQGDSLVLTFTVAPGAAVELRATGYYVPIR